MYGTLGQPAAGTTPGREGASTWTDSSGNFWLFGGGGYDSNGNVGYLNDLWELNPSTREWTWMGGSSTIRIRHSGQPGVYGTLGTPAAGNVPGGRYWRGQLDRQQRQSLAFWRVRHDSNGTLGYLNDLWEFNPSTERMDMDGRKQHDRWQLRSLRPTRSVRHVGNAAAGNIPGGRNGSVSWTDSSGNIWLFGGRVRTSNGVPGYLNDLWKFNPSTREWAWMSGSSMGSMGWLELRHVGYSGCGKRSRMARVSEYLD